MLQSLRQVSACALRSSTPVLSGIMPGSAAVATCLCVWHSVPERATYGTEYACRAQKGFLGYATHFLEAFGVKNRLLRYGRDFRCQKQPSLGTRRIFKGPQNSTCRTECVFKGPQNSRLHRLWTALLPHRTHLQCAKQPPLGGD